jgi:hypothetical protein
MPTWIAWWCAQCLLGAHRQKDRQRDTKTKRQAVDDTVAAACFNQPTDGILLLIRPFLVPQKGATNHWWRKLKKELYIEGACMCDVMKK